MGVKSIDIIDNHHGSSAMRAAAVASGRPNTRKRPGLSEPQPLAAGTRPIGLVEPRRAKGLHPIEQADNLNRPHRYPAAFRLHSAVRNGRDTVKAASLSQFDFNLLLAFEAIYAERHVTRAARRLNVGQPAMSHSLARLRAAFDDELFVRHAGGVQPTPRAIALIEPISVALSAMRSVVEGNRRFNPQKDARTFRVVISDDLEMGLIPVLMAELAAVSDGLRLQTVSANSGRDLDLIDMAQVDLAIGIFPDGGLHHKRRVICDLEPYTVLYDPAVTGFSAPISVDDYVAVRHIAIESRLMLNERIDKALEAFGRRREIALTTPHALAIPFMLKEAPLIATMPRRTAVTLAPRFGLDVNALPFSFPSESILMIWHESHGDDPASLWLRERVMRVAKRIQARDAAADRAVPAACLTLPADTSAVG
ncbi:LysR family transcriptional regulator [Chelatococcus asaccharovorans]|uniref:LysR family transcriptional regulator n=1 Tax=Chelatococcus asaccharovorans TaxID=28210 RepID=A0A2V3U780_9HYPH|nr:LysR family transcriptional regulator [Chelatococcus asaccharovorans]